MNLRTTLAALFLPTRRLIGVDTPLVQPGGMFGGQQWVVPRAECQYRQADLSNLPARHRESAARLAAARYRPTPESATHVAWRDGLAHLWIWAAPPAEVSSGEQRWLPETLLLAPPAEDGVRLLRLARGFEGQLWEGGQLLLSQWWPDVPDAEAWQRFLRAGGLESMLDVPQPLSLPWSAPWGEGRRQWLPGSAAGRERLAWLATGAVVAIMLGWALTGLVRWNHASQQLTSRLDALRIQVAPVLAARERAETAQAELERLRGLQSGTSDYELMAQVAGALPEGILLQSWSRDGEKLRAVVTGGDPDPRKFVMAFAAQPRLADVSATPAGDGMQLVFTLPATPRAGVAP